MKKFALFVAIQLSCFLCFTSQAQRIFSTSYTMNDGLAANRVYSILQDSCGFIWFGTDDGLSRFDGIRFKNYYLSNYIDATTSNSVRKILIDRRGKMWIGLDNGIVIYNSRTDTFIPFEAKTQSGESIQAYITDIVEDADGEIWIATTGKGLYRFNPKEQNTLKVYRNIPGNVHSLSQDVLMTLQQDSRQNIWVGTYSEGLSRFDKQKETFTHYKKSTHNLSDNSIQKIFEDSHGNLWIGTFHNGIDLFNPTTETFSNFRDNNPENLLYQIHDIKEYRPGELFIASDNGIGIFKIESGEIIHPDDAKVNIRTHSNKFIYSIYIDKEESLWLGTYYGGIKFYSAFQNNFEYHSCSSTNAPLTGKVINVIREDKDNNYWIGTDDNGIFRFNARNKSVIPFRSAAQIGTTYYCIHDLLPDDNKLYAATYGRGMEVFDLKTGRIKSYLNNPADSTSLPSSRVFKLFKASNGRIYIGTSNGICYYNPTLDNFVRIASFSGRVSSIVEDHTGRIWVGTSTNGLLSYNVKSGKVTSYQHTTQPNSLTKNVVTTLAIDSRKRLWIGTYGQGFCRYNDETDDFTRYDHLELPNRIITSIIPKNDLLWIATNKGLMVYNPDTETMKTYSKSNGLYNEQFTPNSSLEASDGKVFLGSTDGFCVFFPQNLRENAYHPPLVLTNMTIFGKEVLANTEHSPIGQAIAYTKEMVLDYNQSMIGFDFAALSYIAPQEARYKYILEGLDREWQYAKGSSNHLSYANLPPGNYILRVKGTNSDQMWSSHEVELKIKVLPPYYKSKAAYLFYVLTLLAIVFFSVKSYIKRVKRQQYEHLRLLNDQKEKELYNSKIEFFTHIAHEIRTPLSLIIGPLEHLMKRADINNTYGEYLNIIEQNYKRLYALVTQLLDFRKVDSGLYKLTCTPHNLKQLVLKTTSIFELNARQRGVTINTCLLTDNLFVVIDEEAFTKVLSNLLSNAMKYARSTIDITANEGETETLVSVTDNGIGINSKEKTKIFDAFYQVKNNGEQNKLGIGIGLHMTRSLVQLMNGRIEAKDREDGKSGLTITVALPKSMEIEEKRQEMGLEQEMGLHESPIEKKHSILLVDDNPEILDFLSKVLAEEYFVISVQSGKEALQILENNKINLIVSDVVMEGISGFDLCRHIKTDINLSHIPVILLTAKTDTESKVEGLESGADAYIEKPFSPAHLKAQLLNLLKKREDLQKVYATNPFSDLHTAIHNKLDEEFMHRCTQIILDNISDPEFSVNVLAQETNMSRTSIFTKIKGIIGMTPNDFIKVTRLKEACKMMVEGKYRITEIGFLVGFSSSSYFAKCFSKQFGILPTEFMKNLREEE